MKGHLQKYFCGTLAALQVTMKPSSHLTDIFIGLFVCFFVTRADSSVLSPRDAGDSPEADLKRDYTLGPWRPRPTFYDQHVSHKRHAWDNETWNALKSELKETFNDIQDIVDSGVSKIKEGWNKFKDLYLKREEKRVLKESPPSGVTFKRAEGRRGVFDAPWEAMKTGFKQGVEDAEEFGKDAAERARKGWERFKTLFLKREIDNMIFSQR